MSSAYKTTGLRNKVMAMLWKYACSLCQLSVQFILNSGHVHYILSRLGRIIRALRYLAVMCTYCYLLNVFSKFVTYFYLPPSENRYEVISLSFLTSIYKVQTPDPLPNVLNKSDIKDCNKYYTAVTLLL